MKKSTILMILLIVCIVTAGAAAVLLLGTQMRITYADAEKYTAGETTLNASVENLDIHWVDGRVNIAYHAENTVTITETAQRNITEDMAVRWWMDGSTLRIQYAKSGFGLMKNLNKELTVTLPEGLKLKKAEIFGTSSDLNVPGITADELKLESTSGEIYAAGSAQKVTLASTSGNIRGILEGAEEIAATATSGNISLTQSGTVKTMTAASTSGNISMAAEEAGTLSAGATSGKITLEAKKADKVQVSCTSGDITLSLKAFGELKAEATSGNVTASLPADPGFTGDFSMTSGSFQSAIALAKEGKTYTCGDGSASCAIHTTSGNITLK